MFIQYPHSTQAPPSFSGMIRQGTRTMCRHSQKNPRFSILFTVVCGSVDWCLKEEAEEEENEEAEVVVVGRGVGL